MPKLRFPARWIALALLASALTFSAERAGADPRPREVMNAAEIRLAIEKLGVTGTVLFVAAHPDDENTALLSYLSKGRKVRTIYLSMTRGDGGQNLIGSDTGERLGVIRTQELLAARRIDGAEQRFTRALDFGFSKNADETLELWGRERILEDVVWVIRRMRPDVIVTRFPPDSTAGHGHHAASAILAAEAFRAAADSTRFPEQLQWLRPWQAKRLVWNVFRFGSSGPDTTRGRVAVDIGAYNSLLGMSYTELAGQSRSMHKTQGFGAPERRGSFTNTFAHRDGDPAMADLFEGVDLSWKREPRGELLVPLIEQVVKDYDESHPEASIPALLRVNGLLLAMPLDPIVQQKRFEVSEILRSCAGIWIEGIASAPAVSPGAPLRVVASAIARAKSPLEVLRVELVRNGLSQQVLESRDANYRALPPNRATADTFRITVPLDVESCQPYWLKRAPRGAWSDIDDPRMTGVAENLPSLLVRYVLTANGEYFPIEVPVVYRWVDPVAGERYRALDVVPPAAVSLDRGVYLFPDARARSVHVKVESADVPVSGHVVLELPDGWRSAPDSVVVTLEAGSDTTVSFRVTPGPGPAAASVRAMLVTEFGSRYRQQRVTLDYDHVPMQTLLPPAESRLVRTDLRVAGREVGYVMGSGDQVPQALEEMGFRVALLDDATLEHGDLSRFGTIVTGVRAYNTRPRLLAHQQHLLDWVAAGGRLVVQYNTADAAFDKVLGPRPFKISRDRVTVETAPVRALVPAHPLLTTPNRIGERDFEGWVQERGLYFANSWDPAYTALLSCRDPGEPARDGGLLVAKHGKGSFVYTGYAWFRQLPAGVPGAWRAFANLASAGR